MIKKESRSAIRIKKHLRVRNRFSGTAERPRLAVFRSNNHMYAQIIDDTVGNTLVSASTVQKDVKDQLEKTNAFICDKEFFEHLDMPFRAFTYKKWPKRYIRKTEWMC